MHDEVSVEYNEPAEDDGTSDRDHKLHCFTPEEYLGGWEGETTTTRLYYKTVGGGPNKHCQNSHQLFTPNMGGPQL